MPGVSVEMVLPAGLDSLAETLSNGAFCNTRSSTNVRERWKEPVWSLGTLAVGQQASVTTSPMGSDTGLAIIPGQRIEFVAGPRDVSSNRLEVVDTISLPEPRAALGPLMGGALLKAVARARRRSA